MTATEHDNRPTVVRTAPAEAGAAPSAFNLDNRKAAPPMSKFRNLRDEMVYTRSLDTSYLDGEAGTVDDIGWHGLMVDFYGRDIIVSEDSSGFVYVSYYPANTGEAGKAWNAILDAADAVDS